jgi:transposase
MLRGRDFCSGQKRGRQIGKTKRGKGTKIMGIADGHGLPLALRTESASPAEVTLVEATLEERVLAEMPERLIGDKAYDSDRLDRRLREGYGIEMIAPNKVNRIVPTQDGRPLRRYKRRWKIERLFAWLFNFRRLVVRYEYHAANFQGFVHLAAALILLRHL